MAYSLLDKLATVKLADFPKRTIPINLAATRVISFYAEYGFICTDIMIDNRDPVNALTYGFSNPPVGAKTLGANGNITENNILCDILFLAGLSTAIEIRAQGIYVDDLRKFGVSW